MKKEVNKKLAFWIIGILVVGFLAFLLLIPSCAPCRYGNRTELCTKQCAIYAPTWKILISNLTGKSIDGPARSSPINID